MKAIICEKWGQPEQLQIGELPSPELRPGTIIVAPKAWGVNFADLVLIAGQYQFKPELPFAPGVEISGDVLACAPDVTEFHVGDRIAAYVRWGGYAEEVIVPSTHAVVIPDTMDYPAAAVFPVSYGTAYMALTRQGGIRHGNHVLILGAGGSVGLAAIEISKRFGATVIAVASGEKLDAATAAGADVCINYKTQKIRDTVLDITGEHGIDIVIDPVGGDSAKQAFRCLGLEGRLVTVGFASGDIPRIPANQLLVKTCSAVGSSFDVYIHQRPELVKAGYETLLEWFADGDIRPAETRTFPFECASDALVAVRERKISGKAVLV